MSVVSTLHPPAFVDNHSPLLPASSSHRLGSLGSEANTGTLLSPLSSSMERSAAPEYSQSGLPSPYPSNFGDSRSEASSVDHASAAPYATQEVRSSNYPTSATPTSEYGVYPASARSSSFPEHIQRSYHHPATNPSGGSSGGMAQTPTSPSMPLQEDGRSHQNPQQVKSDSDVPIDPSIANPSPTYAHGQYSPYAAPSQEMAHGYPHSGGLYAQPRPDWSGYGGQPTPITPGHHVFPQTPTTGAPQSRPNQVYSFVPIPGAQQHKRPRRRYEEIERMYKCGWQGCEKAYGTLNHLNAHVTMQSHGQKRTPEEFKEIRKEWKQRKKEEEAQRKADEERQRQQAAAAVGQNGAPADGQPPADGAPPPTSYPGSRAVQLPPIGFQSNQYPPVSGAVHPPLGTEYSSNYMPNNYPPASPYGPAGQPMYSQHNGGQASH